MIELLNEFDDQSEFSLHMLQSHKSLLKSRIGDHSEQFRKTTLQIRCFAHLKKEILTLLIDRIVSQSSGMTFYSPAGGIFSKFKTNTSILLSLYKLVSWHLGNMTSLSSNSN